MPKGVSMSAVQSLVAEDEAAYAQLARTALALWDLRHIDLQLIKIRENAVYLVSCEGGRKAILRVHRHGYHSDAALHSENAWTCALAEAGLRVPRAIASRRGQPFERVQAKGVQGERQVDVIEWIEGRQLGSVEAGVAGDDAHITRQYDILGQTAARMHQQASQWQPGPGFVRHSWCAQGLAGEQPLWGRFWELDALDDAQRRLLVTTRHALLHDLNALPRDVHTFGLIHADLVPENLLAHGDDVHVIDFDDAGFGWHLFDIATSLYFLLPQPCFETAKRALIDGYRKVRPLSDEDAARLPMFLAARGTTYLGWVHERKNTQTARELTPFLVELACTAAQHYLRGH
ncbi:phosphotransferase [Variovorax sp. J22R133]|uniref:phosphotransferase enzyme family protein n=1 Tax=Variovorax brevis TaxID=3053503 RepID=UPI0025767221|nr:phosphotransferase [Variovorax sp. J22R133]MDM0111433.1 phosphotransferase [Variovorax sp. J22R133]